MPTTLSPSGAEQRIDDGVSFRVGMPNQLRPLALAGGNYVLAWRSDDGVASIWLQMFDANGQEVGLEFTAAYGDFLSGPTAIPLSGGGFVLAWSYNPQFDQSGQENDSSVRAQVYSATGSPVGAPIHVNTATQGDQFAPHMTELANGNFAIVWIDYSLGVGGAPGDASGAAVKAQLFAADGSPVGGEILVNTTTANEQTNGHPAALPDGGFAVMWTHRVSATDVDVRAQFFDAAGAKTGPELLVNTTTSGNQSMLDVVSLTNGNVLMVFDDTSADPFSEDLRGRIYSAAGAPVSGEFLINTATANRQYDPQVLAQPGGGFVIAWTDNSGAGSVKAQLFGADGSKIGGEIPVNTTASGMDADPTLVGLPGGGFAIAWTDRHVANDSFVRMQAFDANGLRVGAELQVNTGTDGRQSVPELAAQPDGRVLATYIHANNQNTPFAVIGQFFTPSPPATSGDDTLTGTAGPDVLDGRGGNDVLIGLDGDDYLVGGTGNDRMEGGDGSDVYYVDSAGDTLVEPVAVGNDRVATTISYALGADADIELFEAINSTAPDAMDLTGNGFGQTIVGNAGVNHIDAGGGADLIDGLGGDDVLAGGAGDDYLIGGSGADSMDGGAGSDIYYVDNAADVLIDAVGPGSDRVAASVSYTLTAGAQIEIIEAITLSATDAFNFTGNGFGQTMVGNNGANVLDGKGGDDIIAGLGGADTFAFTSALGAGNVDTIADFSAVDDTIALDDAVFIGLAPGALSASAFVTGTAAGDADDRIIYNASTGALYFDADGSGAGAMVQFATLFSAPAITAADFTVI